MTLNKSGSIIGIPEVPDSGSDFSTWTSPSEYRIKLQEGNKFTQSMDENTKHLYNYNYVYILLKLIIFFILGFSYFYLLK